MELTWLGTAGIRIQTGKDRILFDPFVQLVGGENPNCIDDFLQDQVICITHGHLDHLMEAAELLEEESGAEVTVFCGSVAADTLSKLTEDTDHVAVVRPGTRIQIGTARVQVWEGVHARPGLWQKTRKLLSPGLFRHFRNALALAWLHPKFPEGGQTYLYEVEAEGKRVLVMGSLGLKDGVDYPTGADLLILPFQGSAHLEQEALRVVERLRPRRILLDHFDDAFPPVSESVDTRRFKKRMDESFPQIPVVKPAAGKKIVL